MLYALLNSCLVAYHLLPVVTHITVDPASDSDVGPCVMTTPAKTL